MVQLATTAAPTIDWPTIPRDAMRILDIVITLLLLMFFGPLCLAVAICIKATSHGPVIYRQRRIGYLGQEFYCLKFRTMRHDADARLAALLQHDLLARIQWSYDHKLRHDPRITPLGKFLRRSSIDELPQLINVLQGSMSLVGPRPIVAAEIPRYGRRFVHYTAMRPGITGLWQVSGRNDTTYRRRIALDVVFARRRSLGLYGRIMMLTVPAVLLQRGSR
ncbi:sugar transferase [Sphingomonas sp. PvP056]|jgi:exopolysaccharide production protein ExoY|uniref:sugar transferase n=1 Tax=Sphingomonas sp. PvP056 TaxID=3156392 RepID=UPI00263DB9BD|nr:sugar transferase [Sphingomonas sp. PsM26]